MKRGVTNYKMKEIIYDDDLCIEAYRFNGVAQSFPNHFHEYYVIGLIESGERQLTVNNIDYHIGPGDLITFNPMDNHACVQVDDCKLVYHCFNINRSIMADTVSEVFNCRMLPHFKMPVQYRTSLSNLFCSLHDCIMENGSELEKDEKYLLFIEQLLASQAELVDQRPLHHERDEIKSICVYLEENYENRISLDELADIAKLNKYSLVRLFTKQKGITPYRYLETIRINKAKQLIENGIELAHVAQLTGFSDQSHFSKYFNRFIGLPPGQYQAIFRNKSI